MKTAEEITRLIFLRLMENHNTITPDMQLHIEDVLKEQLPQFSKEVTDDEIDAWAFQGHPPVDKFDRGYAIGKKHGAIAMRDGLIEGEGNSKKIDADEYFRNMTELYLFGKYLLNSLGHTCHKKDEIDKVAGKYLQIQAVRNELK